MLYTISTLLIAPTMLSPIVTRRTRRSAPIYRLPAILLRTAMNAVMDALN